MRVLRTFLAVTACLLSWRAPAASLQNLERITVSGSDYVRLGEWAEAFNFHLKWARNSDTAIASNTLAHLQFTMDSRKAEIDGVVVWLSLPVINRGGLPLISLADLRTTLQPLLFPQPSASAVQTICLDPGHGGKDKGEIDRSHYEKEYNLLVAREVEAQLKALGFNVFLTRDDDHFVELADRPSLARQKGADLFVSLHYNSAAPAVRGVEVYCLTPPGLNSSNEGGGKSNEPAFAGNEQNDRNALLAYEMQRSLVRSLPLDDRGMKHSRFEVLREARIPAILVEGGFMSNPTDAARIYDPAFRKKMARAIVDGILAFKQTTSSALAQK